MKAVVYRKYGAPEVLQIEEMDRPVPAENDVLVRIKASAITSADAVFRLGKPYYVRLFAGLFGPKQKVMGTEMAGEVVQVGNGVSRFKKGDLVYGATGVQAGTYAEYTALDEAAALARMPGNVDFSEAAGISEGALTALPFLRDHAKVRAGQEVLVNGASGSVGVAAVQIAKHYGAKVTAVCSARNADFVRSIGADAVIDYHTEDFTNSGKQYDVIFDAVGKRTYSRCKKALKKRGIYLTTVPSIGILFQMLWTAKFGDKRAIFAATGLRKPAERAKDLIFIKELVESGALKPTIDKRYPMDQAAEAHRYVDTGRKRGNVVFEM